MKAISHINTARVDAVHTPTITRLAGGRKGDDGDVAPRSVDSLDRMDATPTPRGKKRSASFDSLRKRLTMRTPSPPKDRAPPTSARVTPPSASPKKAEARRVRVVLGDATNTIAAPAATKAPAAVVAAPVVAPAVAPAAAAPSAKRLGAYSLAFWAVALALLARAATPPVPVAAPMATSLVVVETPEPVAPPSAVLLAGGEPALPLGLLAKRAAKAFLDALFLPLRAAAALARTLAPRAKRAWAAAAPAAKRAFADAKRAVAAADVGAKVDAAAAFYRRHRKQNPRPL